MADYVKGLVSVIVPTYKRSDMLLRCINSVLNQTYKNIELIVVNDNEKGDEYSLQLYEKLSSVTDERFRFIEQEKHINGAVARNFGIKNATGEYICFLDDDDYINDNKIERQVEELSKLDSSYGGVSCLLTQVKNGKLTMVKLPYSTKNLMERVLSRRVRIGTGAVLFRRKALDDAGYFDEGLMRHQDVQLFAYFASKYKLKLIKEYLYVVDISDGQNRPSAEKLYEIKRSYYKSVAPLFDKLTKRQVEKIYIMHDVEIAAAYVKRGEYLKGISMLKRLILHPSTILYTVKLSAERFIAKNFKNILIRRLEK